ncbi:methyl-accepting chemotaxis protein [Propionivibrio sp.]|uniref:methyl-accepting chemotaxis protein n=1 Tax=Propionivibrio sp. TaxID=2212460 RepID=UPI003BF45266
MFSDATVKTRLTLIIIVAALALLITGVIGVRGMGDISGRLKAVYQDRTVPLIKLSHALDTMHRIRSLILTAASEEKTEFSEEILKEIPELDTELNQLMTDYATSELPANEKQLVADFQAAWKNYTEARTLSIKLIQAGDTSSALYNVKNNSHKKFAPAREAMSRLIDIQAKTTRQEFELGTESYLSARLIMIVFMVSGVIGVILLSMRTAGAVMGQLGGEPKIAVKVARKIAEGDLSHDIPVAPGDQNSLMATLKHMQNKLNSILREVEDCGRHMGQSAFQVAAISNEISEVSKEQENRSDEVSSAMQQLHQISSNVQTKAIEAADRSRRVETLAREGIENVHQNIGSMEETTQQVSRASVEIQELEQSAQLIHNIVNAIKEIAGQTNLLALNAAIEASRAGEQGRGFAVVADEVRKLADRTSKSATEVSDIIGQLSGKVQQVATTMDVVVQKVNVTQKEAGETAHTIEGMASNAVETAQANQGISGASHQQLDQFGRLESTMETLFSILKDSGSKVETTAAIGDDLRQVTGRLNNIMSGFTFKSRIVIATAQHEKRRVPRAQNSLRVKTSQNSGKPVEGLSSDFSLTGLRLRITQPMNEREPVDLYMYLPNDDLKQYENQTPLSLKGRISWQRKEGSNYFCGVEFVNLDEDKRNMIKKCFAFFNKNAEF